MKDEVYTYRVIDIAEGGSIPRIPEWVGFDNGERKKLAGVFPDKYFWDDWEESLLLIERGKDVYTKEELKRWAENFPEKFVWNEERQVLQACIKVLNNRYW